MKPSAIFLNRQHAGDRLADLIRQSSPSPSAIVFGLPRGGVPVAAQVAHNLGLALDIFVVRKLGLPRFPQIGMGAIASGGNIVLTEWILENLPAAGVALAKVIEKESDELERQERVYAHDSFPSSLVGREVIVVDDGVASGARMRAAIGALRARGARRVVVAIPVANAEACRDLAKTADQVICCAALENFSGVGDYYEHFEETHDEDVRALLTHSQVA
jgi:putative phosphoribosyl transferase